MELLPKETIVTRSDSDAVVLTTHRIRYQDKDSLTSIMLDKVSGVEMRYTRKPLFLVMSLLSVTAGAYLLVETASTVAAVFIVAGIILFFLYIDSRKHIVSIASSSTRITFHTKSMGKEEVKRVITLLEAQILNLGKS